MADDITLTVRVRDMTRGDFNRLDQQLDRMRRNLRGVARDGESAGMHTNRLTRDIGLLQQRFQRMQQTGSLTRRELTQLRGSLDAMSRSALQAARSGEITHDSFRRVNSEIGSLRAQFSLFDRDLSRNSNNLVRTNNHLTQTVRTVNGVTRSITTSRRDINGTTRVINTFRQEADRAGTTLRTLGSSGNITGGAFSNLRNKLIGAAVVLAASLLPTIGALAPMLAGIGSIAGVAALAFMGLHKPTKQLTQDEKDFLTALKPLKKEFSELQATARKAVLPGLSKSFKDIGTALKSLNPVISIAGKAFTDLVDKIAKGVASDDFMGPFLDNVKMGTDWVLDFAGSIGTFTKAFLDFGSKSQPALDAWQNLLGGFLDTGLPKMFKEMEPGIKGSSDYLNGLANVINNALLPGLGKLVAHFMEAFGPTLGQLLTDSGTLFTSLVDVAVKLFDAFGPVVRIFGSFASGLANISRIGLSVFGDLVAFLGGAFLNTLTDTFGNKSVTEFTGTLQGFSGWVKENEGAIRESFVNIAKAVVMMVDGGIQAIPQLIGMFYQLTNVVLTTLDGIISGADMAFGWIPGIGDDLHNANTEFDKWAAGVRGTLTTAQQATQEFADKAHSNLARVPLQLDVSQAKANLEDIKKKLEDPNLTKERRAQLTADKENAEYVLRQAEASLQRFDGEKADATLSAHAQEFFNQFNRVQGARLNSKSVVIRANPGAFWSAVGGIAGRVLGTSYINVQMRKVDSNFQDKGFASGGIVRHFADGGKENHVAQIAPAGSWRVWGEPETGGEAYIPLSPAKRSRSRSIAEQTVGALGGNVQWFANGGSRDARRTLASSFGINYFGRLAGWNTTPFERSLARPSDTNALVGFINQTLSTIKSAFSGGWEKYLVRKMTDSGKALIGYQNKLLKVNASLDKAKESLDNLKTSATQLKEGVAQTILGEADITKSANAESSRVTINTILSQMTGSAANAKEFDAALKKLKQRGLSKDLIAQVAQAGVSGGGLETAQALLGANSAQIKELNALQGALMGSANSAGQTAADAMYGAGIKAAEGLVKGLTAQKAAIEKAMLNIAKAMEKAIKKALGIKSPSRVMQKVGHFTAEGFVQGVKKNRKIDNAWESMLTVPTSRSGGASYTPHPSASGQPIVVQIEIGGRRFGEVIIDPLRQAIHHRGGDVQATLGK